MRELKDTISDSGFHNNMFTAKTHNCTSFKNSITNSWFHATHSLIFNPARSTHEPLNSSSTRSHILFFNLVKIVKPNSTLIHSWLLQTAHSRFVIQANLFQITYRISAKTRLVSFKTRFDQSSRFNSPPFPFNILFSSVPQFSRGPGVRLIHLVLSWCSYDSTRSTHRQFSIYRDVIQLEDFTQCFFWVT